MVRFIEKNTSEVATFDLCLDLRHGLGWAPVRARPLSKFGPRPWLAPLTAPPRRAAAQFAFRRALRAASARSRPASRPAAPARAMASPEAALPLAPGALPKLPGFPAEETVRARRSDRAARRPLEPRARR